MSPFQTYPFVCFCILVVTAVFIYLHRQDPFPFLKYWVLGYALFSARVFLLFFHALLPALYFLSVLADIGEILSAYYILRGALSFIGDSLPDQTQTFAFLYCIGYAAAAFFPSAKPFLPIFSHFPPGLCLFYGAWILARKSHNKEIGEFILIASLILWGLHKFDYPILSLSPSWSLLGFWLTALLALQSGFGMTLIYYEYARIHLRKSEVKYRRLVETTNTGYVILDTEGRVLDANREYQRLTGRDNLGDLIGHPVLEWTAAENRDTNEKAIASCILEGTIRNLEIDYTGPDDRRIPIEINATYLKDEMRPVIIALCKDISQRKLSENQLKKALAEKETLLREIHHRTKNNMNIIISLLNLQADESDQPAIRRGFEDARNRIYAMALVHEKLYGSEDLARLDLGDYLKDLAEEILDSHDLGSQVSLHFALADIAVTLDSAIPCGLVLHELLSNALRHAFPVSRAGNVSIGLRRETDDRVVITIADDGIGFPPDFDIRRKGKMGLKTAIALTEGQLRGRIALTSGKGSCFTISFPR